MARIGINALYLIPGGVGGTEIYLRELLKALAHRRRRSVFRFYQPGDRSRPDSAPSQLPPESTGGAREVSR